jgi:acetylcholinesterase/cholinesterase
MVVLNIVTFPLTCPNTTSEDCLYLNIWTPRLASLKAPAPVLVFLAGGHFDEGTGGDALYDSEFMANMTNSIVVVPNYRLGALGWLVTDTVEGNFGLNDQRLAIRWVQNNIQNFGGNPQNITIFGQSAGATSVATHLTSVGSRDLNIAKAIKSNPWSLPLKTPAQAKEIGGVFLLTAGCPFDTMECLRGLSIDTILRAEADAEKTIPVDTIQLFYPFTPLIDGKDVVQNPMNAFLSGDFNPAIPVVLGSVANETVLFIYPEFPKPVGVDEFKTIILTLFPFVDYNQILAHYPIPAGTNDTRPLLSQVGTDYLFTCPTRKIARTIDSAGGNAWLYFYNHVLSFKEAWGPNYTFCWNAVCHASELPFVFHSAQDAGYQYTPPELLLTNQMVTYWANFARSSDPNNPQTSTGSITWPPYHLANSQNIELAIPLSVQSFWKNSTCDFWDTVGYDIQT